MDKVDREILYQLQLNARLPNNELADVVGLSPSSCHRRVRILEAAGIIRGYAAVVDPTQIGRGYEVLIWVTLDQVTRASMATVEERFLALDEIAEAHRMMGQPDYLLKICVADAPTFETFYIDVLAGLPHVQTLTSMTTMKTVKRSQPVRLTK